MQRSYVAAILLAACGTIMSSCEFIFGKEQKSVTAYSFTGNWKVIGDSASTDSIFNYPVFDSIGTIRLLFEADSLLTAKRADSVILQVKYYQNSVGDTLYLKQDSGLHIYPALWKADSNVSLFHADKSVILRRQ